MLFHNMNKKKKSITHYFYRYHVLFHDNTMAPNTMLEYHNMVVPQSVELDVNLKCKELKLRAGQYYNTVS